MRSVKSVEQKAAALKLDMRGLPQEEAFWTAVRRLWVATLRHPWRTLVVTPASRGLAARDVARALCVVGVNEVGEALEFVDGTGMALAAASETVAEITGAEADAPRRIVVTDAPIASETAAALALCADAAVVGVRLGQTTEDEVERTVAEIGASRVIGSVLLDEEDAS